MEISASSSNGMNAKFVDGVDVNDCRKEEEVVDSPIVMVLVGIPGEAVAGE